MSDLPVSESRVPDPRAATNPVFGPNRMKIGVFATNLNDGASMTTVEERWRVNWPDVVRIARAADAAGLEAMVPVARWKGLGGVTDHEGTSFETYTWAAAVAAVTERIAVFSTSHVPAVHPVFAAKQAVTIDHISAGRFGLNIVCGWFGKDLDLFGASHMGHDELYEYAQEWLDVVRAVWTRDEEFDHVGRHFTVRNGRQKPLPVQKPAPALMNAGRSEVGMAFAARNCDMMLVSFGHLHPHPAGSGIPPTDEEYAAVRAQVEALRDMARRQSGRPIQVWSRAYVVCRPTEREALDYVRHYVYEKGDWEAVESRQEFGRLSPEAAYAAKSNVVAGSGGYPLVGTAEQIVDRLEAFSRRCGIDGLLVTWIDPVREVPQFVAEVLPLMVQAGLREPAPVAAVRGG
jgi:FMNH2-dependent dimethyl sulfone monooxygenase